MSGGSVPYHLRQNKSVERSVFIDALMHVARATPYALRNYRYVGFAGPFSEDFKLVHAQLGINKFESIESDEHVLKRQKWNTPLKGIIYQHKSAREYIDVYQSSEPTIIWLDYADPRALASQLSEFESLISKVADYDVIKVTFNASAITLGGDGVRVADPIAHRIDKASERLSAYLPAGFDIGADDVDAKGFPSLVLRAAENAAKAGMAGKPSSRFQLLTTFTYADSSHRILTMTGIVLPDSEVSSFFRATGIRRWKLATTQWGDPRTIPIDIAVPEMSLRERLYVDQQLPHSGGPKRLMRSLGFRLGGRADEDTINALQSYSRFYRYFPYFSKMIV